MVEMKKLLLEASKQHFVAARTRAIANISNLLINSVGIGEHPDIIEEIVKQTETLSNADDCIETLEAYWGEDETEKE